MVVGPPGHDSLVENQTPQPELELISVQPKAQEIKYADTPLKSGHLVPPSTQQYKRAHSSTQYAVMFKEWLTFKTKQIECSLSANIWKQCIKECYGKRIFISLNVYNSIMVLIV